MENAKSRKNRLINGMNLNKPAIRLLYRLMFLAAALLALICLFPPLWTILSGFKDLKEFLAAAPTILPHSFHPEKLWLVWNKYGFLKYYMNSVFMAAGDLLFSILFNALFGYALSKIKPKGTPLLVKILFWTVLMPNTVSMVPIYKNIIHFPLLHTSLINTFLPMWFMSGANAFFVLLFKGFFDGIPTSLIEAADLDGCGMAGIFARIMLPLSKPIIFVVAIFTLNGSWANFFWPYMTINELNMKTMMVRLFDLSLISRVTADIRMLAILLAMLPPAVIFLFLHRRIMDGGLNVSGIKG